MSVFSLDGLCFESPRVFSTTSFSSHDQILSKSRDQNRGAGKPTDSNVLSLCEQHIGEQTQNSLQCHRVRRKQRSPQNTALSKSLSTALLFSHRLPPVLSCHHTPSQAHNLQTRQDTGPLVYSLSGLQRSPRRGTPSYIQKKPPSPGAGLALATLPLAFPQKAK